MSLFCFRHKIDEINFKINSSFKIISHFRYDEIGNIDMYFVINPFVFEKYFLKI